MPSDNNYERELYIPPIIHDIIANMGAKTLPMGARLQYRHNAVRICTKLQQEINRFDKETSRDSNNNRNR